MDMKRAWVVFSGSLLAAASAMAADPAELPAAQREAVEAALARVAPGLQVDAVRAAAMPGLVEVEAGGQLLYLSADGRHLLQGSLIDTVNRVDLSEQRHQQRRASRLQNLPADSVVSFAAAEPSHRVTVFTALECGYCKRFHSDIQSYLDAGISVDYVLIPLAGEGSEGDQNGARVFCADDRQDAFTRATAGASIEGPMCESGYTAGKALAAALGIRNTPTIVLADGRSSGYLDAAALSESLASLAPTPR
jgi:thiol:disulfide interchange protein DsbC